MDKILLCDHCLNRNGSSCKTCTNNKQVAGREKTIERLKETGKIKDSAKLRNIVEASEIVLFKDLCRVLDVSSTLAN